MWEQLKNKFGEELVAAAWKTRRLLGGLASTSEIFLGCFYQSVDLE